MLNDSRVMASLPRGHDYNILFCAFRKRNLTPQNFIRMYFVTELWLSIVFVLGAVGAVIWGFSYFTLESQGQEHNREFYALVLGTGAIILLSFRLYLVLKSLKFLRRNDFHPIVFCCELCCRACQAFQIITLLFLAVGCYNQGVFDITDGQKGHRWLETDLGYFLIALSAINILLLAITCSQFFLGSKCNKALHEYFKDHQQSGNHKKFSAKNGKQKSDGYTSVDESSSVYSNL